MSLDSSMYSTTTYDVIYQNVKNFVYNMNSLTERFNGLSHKVYQKKNPRIYKYIMNLAISMKFWGLLTITKLVFCIKLVDYAAVPVQYWRPLLLLNKSKNIFGVCLLE